MANGIDFGTAIGLIKGLGSPDPAVIESAVSDWLDDHPEATTTVQDGSITKAKLDSNLQGTVDDVADLKSQKADVDLALGAYPTDTVSGSMASFSDGADGIPVKDLIIGIEPVQSGSGDPSPDNVRPISGWTGVNVTRTASNAWNEEWEHGQYAVQTGEKIPSSVHIRCKYPIPVKPNTEYFYSTNGYNINVCYLDADMEYIGNFNSVHDVKKTTPDNCYYVVFNMAQAYGVTYNHDISINYPATDTTYHPYVGTSIPITFPSEAGAVYGGTLDVTTGVLSVRPYYASYAGETLVGPWVSSMDVYTPGTTPTAGAQVVDMGGTVTSYQLSPVDVLTLLGANTIYADTGGTTVTYRADPTLYADKRSTATRSIIAGIEPTMTASKAYTTGQLLIVGDTLYKVAASIASGATLTPGTNVNPTTVAEQLLLLANA